MRQREVRVLRTKGPLTIHAAGELTVRVVVVVVAVVVVVVVVVVIVIGACR